MAANQSSGGTPQSSTPPDATPGQPAAANRKQGRKRGRKPGDGTVQTFRSPTAAVIWVVWLLFAVANWIDLAVQGRDHLSVVAAAHAAAGDRHRLRHGAAAQDHRGPDGCHGQEPAARPPDRLGGCDQGGPGRPAAGAHRRPGPAPQGHQLLGGALLAAAQACRRVQSASRLPPPPFRLRPALRRPRLVRHGHVAPTPGRSLGRGGSGEDRPHPQRARHRGSGRDGLGHRERRAPAKEPTAPRPGQPPSRAGWSR